MIEQTLTAIVSNLNAFMGTLSPPDVMLGNISLIDSFQDTSGETLDDKVIASVINIQQEGSLRNLPFRRTVFESGLPAVKERQPEIYLNIYVLFGANKSSYKIALQRITQVISFFQQKRVFTSADIPNLPEAIDKVIFDLYSTSFDELNQLWSVMGGKYIPSVVYKMRMALVQESQEIPAAMIEEINLNAGNLGITSNE